MSGTATSWLSGCSSAACPPREKIFTVAGAAEWAGREGVLEGEAGERGRAELEEVSASDHAGQCRAAGERRQGDPAASPPGSIHRCG